MSGRGFVPEVGALQQEIDQTRGALAQTVQELAGRVDVPARARAAWAHRIESLRRSARRAGRTRSTGLLVGAGAGMATMAVVVVLVFRGRPG
jgi:hypothetical protein